MLTPDDIVNQQELLTIYRRNLDHLLEQAAQYGGEKLAPVSLMNAIEETRASILHIKTVLRAEDVAVEDKIDDVEPPAAPLQSSLTHMPQAPTMLPTDITSTASRLSPAAYKSLSESSAIITARDGTTTTVFADTLNYCISNNPAVQLDNGYTLQFDSIKRIDVVRAEPPGGKSHFHILLLNGSAVTGETNTCSFIGQTVFGRFELATDKISSIEILR